MKKDVRAVFVRLVFCSAHPDPRARTVQWNGTTLHGETTDTLSLLAVTTAQAGEYAVRIANVAGAIVSTSVTLTVLTPPLFTGPPVPRAVYAFTNDTVGIVSDATGSAPIRWQWMRNGVAVPDGTSARLSFTAAAGHVGSALYTAVATNAAGRAESAPVLVVVLTHESSALPEDTGECGCPP